MICRTCVQGARYMLAGSAAAAQVCHDQCPGGTWCPCQHVVTATVLRHDHHVKHPGGQQAPG